MKGVVLQEKTRTTSTEQTAVSLTSLSQTGEMLRNRRFKQGIRRNGEGISRKAKTQARSSKEGKASPGKPRQGRDSYTRFVWERR